MNPEQPVYDPADDDTEGHRFERSADTERDETDDTEGHKFTRAADTERDENDDTEGHKFTRAADTEGDETDVSGHLSGALGSKAKDHDR